MKIFFTEIILTNDFVSSRPLDYNVAVLFYTVNPEYFKESKLHFPAHFTSAYC